jgi:outer membrane lipoprotein SlyB
LVSQTRSDFLIKEFFMATETSLPSRRGPFGMVRARTVHLIAVAALAGLAACQPTTGGGGGGTQTLQVVDSQPGTITGVQQVPVPASGLNRAGGAVAGAVVGGLLGNQVGQGTGRDVATAVGVIGGAAAGNALAQQTNAGTIPQWTVALDNGRSVAVQSNDASLRIGARVRVQQLSNGELRIGLLN